MRKSTRSIKKLLALFLVVLMSIESLGAIVGDNDGSAFVTKAEFEALKDTFNNQIENYNTSIDSKIDGAIASYLAGVRISNTEMVPLLFQFTATSTNKAICVEDGYNTICKQTFQGGSFLHSWFTAHSWQWAANGFKPLGPSDNNWNTHNYRTAGWNWTYLSILGRSYYDQMEGYVFDDENNEIIKNKYKYDNCILNLSMNSSANQNFGTGDPGDRLLMGIRPGGINDKLINRTYFDTSCIGLGNGDANSWGCGGAYLATSITPDVAKNNWCDELPIPRSFAQNYGRYSNASGYPEDVASSIFRISHSTNNEDKDIYIYNSCHDVIYAHSKDAETLEEYSDYMDKINASVDKDTLTIGGASTNLYLSDITEKWAWAYAPFDSTELHPKFVDDVTTTDTRFIIGPRRNWRFTPKFKLKNESTIVPPNTSSMSGGTNYWNTLNQFKNGYLEFKDYNGNTIQPRFYGGLPLISLGNQSIDKLAFDLQITPTTTTGTIPTEICVQIKKSQFPNENETSNFTTNDLNDLVNCQGVYGSTTYSYDEANHYLKIPVNTKINVQVDLPEKNTTYYLRWWENGNAKKSGGKIVELNNGTITVS